jgi:hypothetical protein
MSFTPGTQNMQHDNGASVAVCSDGDVVVAGYVLEMPETYIYSTCTTSNPLVGGVWVTKINPNTGVVAWSYVYDWFQGAYASPSYPFIGYVTVVNDGTDNFAVKYKDLADMNAIMKVDINGSLVYSRRYMHTWGDGQFLDISSGIGNTDIHATGNLTDGINFNGGWNVVAYDNIQEYCHAENLEVAITEQPYEVFGIEVNQYNANPKSLVLWNVDLTINHNVDCEKIEVEDPDNPGDDDGGGNKNAIGNNANVAVTHDIISGDVSVHMPAHIVYNGKLLNNLGQVIATYSNLHDSYKINTSGLASGMYFLHLDNGRERSVKPVVVR